MKPIVIIRPQPGCDASLTAAKALGLDAHGFPMFDIRPLPWQAPDPEGIDALLIGSANALRHCGPALAALTGKPAYAVGEKTAQAAREVGLEVIETGEGGLQDVLGKLHAGHLHLLRLAGKERVALTPPEGVTITDRIVYANNPVPMPPALTALLDDPAVVLLHSAEAARHFRASCTARDIDLSVISIAAIGPRVAEAAGRGWETVKSAEMPSDDALLAMARQMCEEPGRSQTRIQKPRQGLMQDQTGMQAMAAMPPSRYSRSGQITIAVLAFALGAAAVVWSAWRGYLAEWLPESETASELAALPGAGQEADAAAAEEPAERSELKAVSTVEARVAMLEDRLSRLNLQANAASGNAARAESLLIAFATRRMVDRGEPLRYLADQLRLRFANAQPRAVTAIIDFAEKPVTIDELSARLEALSPQLAGDSDEASFWDKAMHELSNLFTVRRTPSALLSPEARIERARVMLRAGKIPAAIEQIELLPGADSAETWVADAKRYAEVQQALDLIETAAMLEPNRLQDSEGNRVSQPSPLATPTGTPDVKAKQ